MGTAINRDTRIDFLKAIATLLVLNSHMGVCYKDYSFLATGGAIGDALFFFASGFTLFLGRMDTFDNWYKRRIMRIFPTVFVVGLIAALFFGDNNSFLDIILCKQYWFIPTILICYIPLYLIRRFFNGRQTVIAGLVYLMLFGICFIILYDNHALFYGKNILWRKFFYLSLMIFGAIVGKNKDRINWKPWMLLALIGSVFFFYILIYLLNGSSMQIVSSIPLMGISFCIYVLGDSRLIKRIDNNSFCGNLIYILGSICLESYLIQNYIISDSLNILFPLNILIIAGLVLVSAYAIHMVSEIVRRIMDSKPFDWDGIILHR